MTQIQTGQLWTAPSGAEFEIVDVSDGKVTVDTHRLPDGTRSELRNTQTYSVAEMEAAKGWVRQ